MLNKIRNSFTARVIAVTLAINLISNFLLPLKAYALTGGPSQPEVQSFEPIGTTDMVNLFTGDFTYNIPLMDVGGYPINLSYNAGITMDQEASWVGLGWNLNPGVVTRNMRGLPDDFNGTEQITKEFNMKPNITYTGTMGTTVALLGKTGSLSLSRSMGAVYNNYNGLSMTSTFGLGTKFRGVSDGPLTMGLGLNVSNGPDGVSASPNISLSLKVKDKEGSENNLGLNIGTSINSRQGLKAVNFGLSASQERMVKTSKVDKNGDAIYKKRSGSLSGGSAISFAASTYVPQVNMPMKNLAISASISSGATFMGGDISGTYSGSYSKSELLTNSQSLNAYGYMYTSNGQTNNSALLDFNRENDGSFTQNTPALPLTNYTYDIYSAVGQGIGSSFRARRGDAGYMFDHASGSQSSGYNVGGEVHVGNSVQGGADLNVNFSDSKSGVWSTNNAMTNAFASKGKYTNNVYEPYYFKQAGEIVPVNESYYSAIGYNRAQRAHIMELGKKESGTAPILVDRDGIRRPITSQFLQSTRDKRNQVISTLVVAAMDTFSVSNRSIYSSANSQHVGEITVTKEDGTRYVYGLPVYNTSQKEVTFNVSGNAPDCLKGLVSYSGSDNSTSNSKGKDNYYNAVTTPAYSHSHMLTEVLSTDYVDIDNIRGPSEGDYGSYTKFSYTSQNYKWRVPFEQNKATYNESLKSDFEDDKGSYIYGTKELKYLDTIQTKTHIAIFYKSNRKDGYGVESENGAFTGSSTPMQRLDSIKLYSIADWREFENNAQHKLTSIKEVHFVYDYSLCKNIPNNIEKVTPSDPTATGKLTLKQVYFKYGNSYKGKLSPYEFTYSSNNPDYNHKAYDRWGHYKPNRGGCTIESDLAAYEFPYTDQDSDSADYYAEAWSLTEIFLPSGGKIVVDYESDDYAFVQDRPAMQMVKILGMGSSPAASPTERIYTIAGGAHHEYLFFDLPEIATTDGEFYSKYLANALNLRSSQGQGNFLYFKFLIDLTAKGDYDYVPGYFKLAGLTEGTDYGVKSGGTIGWVKVKKVDIGDRKGSRDVSPIAKSAWGFAKNYIPFKAFDGGGTFNGSFVDVIKKLADKTLSGSLKQLFEGTNKTFESKYYASEFVPEKSWVRLANPNKFKKGGGVRVKSVKIYDNWDLMNSSEDDFNYGQEYSYTQTYKVNEQEYEMSSGVASYEPLIGADESPFKMPVYFSEEHLLIADDEYYVEEPFGESFFPGPGVGYGKVTVKNLARTSGETQIVKRHATGKVINEFYTARDFPTKVSKTPLVPIPQKSRPLAKVFKFNNYDYMTASQGFVVETNDMHGKQKSQKVYAEDKVKPISGVEYTYGRFGNSLDNRIKTINESGIVETKEAGVEVDFVADFREATNTSQMISAQINNYFFIIPTPIPIPVYLPPVIPYFAKEETRFRSSVLTKVVNKYGILQKTEAFDLGSKVTTENVAYDDATGGVILTKTQNDFEDPVYSFTYPANWMYDRMGGAYQNIGYASAMTLTGGTGAFNDANLVVGDEVILYNTSSGVNVKAWVWDDEEVDTDSKKYMIDENGTQIGNGTYVATVIRSGRRNQQGTPVGTITALRNPIENNGSNDVLIYADMSTYDPDGWEIVNANSVEYSDRWGTYITSMEDNLCVVDLGGALVRPSQFTYDLVDYLNHLASIMPSIISGTLGANGKYKDYSIGGFNASNNSFIKHIEDYFVANTSNGYAPPVNFGLYNDTLSIVGTPQPNVLEIFLFNSNTAHGTNSYACDDYYALKNNSGNISDIKSIDYSIPVVTTPSAGVTRYQFSGKDVNNTTITIYFESYDANPYSDCLPELLGSDEVKEPCTDYISNCDPNIGDIVNPFVYNLRGNFRPKTSYLYLGQREQSNTSNNLYIREDGTFSTFSPFWQKGNDWQMATGSWTYTSTVSQYSPYGFEVENKDPLNRYSSAVYGYADKLPIAVASNAEYRNIGYDGFEDYGFMSAYNECTTKHFNFKEFEQYVTDDDAHTGRYSIQLIKPTGATPIGGNQSPTNIARLERRLSSVNPLKEQDDIPYTVKAIDNIGVFSPITYRGDREYVVSYWVKETRYLTPLFDESYKNNITTYNKHEVNIFINSSLKTPTNVTRSEIIDGWQKVDYRFSIPANMSGNIEVHLVAKSGVVNFDDIRIQPFNSSMKTFVYDPLSLRLMAELDENNFATLYEYSEEGALTRIKKETERGIVTIQESRNSSHKKGASINVE